MSLVLSPAGRRYGYKPSPPDFRDFSLLSAPVSTRNVRALPALVDLEEYCGPVFDQGQEGSCTANAGDGNAHLLFGKYRKERVTLSRAFLYYMSRKLDGTLDQGDCGSTGRTVCRVLNQFGCCLETDMPYVAGDFDTAPTQEQMDKALSYKSGAYHLVNSVADIKSCTASGYPVMTGFTVYDSFESQRTADTGVMPVPDKAKEQVLGGHEVLIIGYDDSKQAFKTRNSWGSDWGANGNFWFPYECAADPAVLIDAWMQHLGHAW